MGEPATNYAALRGQQDFRKGESGIGVMFTAVNRSLDPLTDAALRQSAYVGALDFRHRFLGSRYQLSGSLDVSRVAGTAAAIAATQRDPVHYYQRPDAGLPLDPTRTSLSGDAEELLFGKVGGGITRFETSYQRRSPGFEVNDLGFLLRRPAELEQLVRGAVTAPVSGVSNRVLELQLVAVLDGRRTAGRARRQHQRARAAQQPLVAPRRYDAGPTRHDVRRPTRARWPGRAGRSHSLLLGGMGRRHPAGRGAGCLGELLAG